MLKNNTNYDIQNFLEAKNLMTTYPNITKKNYYKNCNRHSFHFKKTKIEL